MAIPPVTTNSLLNLPAPISPGTLLAKPVALPKATGVNFQAISGMPGYAAAYQPGSPYSATNLPEFMKDYQQTPSGKFVMNQGILGMPPQIDKVQSLFSQGYAQEYQPLEQKFQESFAFDPTMFGDMYRAGQLVPNITLEGVEQNSNLNPALAIAGVGALNDLYPYAKDLLKEIDLPSVSSKEQPEGPPEQTFAQKFEENVTQPVKAATIDPIVAAWQESQLKKSADQKITDLKKWADDTFDKPEFINDLQEGAKQYIKDFKDSGIIANTKIGIDAIGNLENFISKPTAVNAYDAVDSIDQLNSFLPESLQFKLPASTADVGASIGATLSVGRAIKDPSVENIASAYGGIDELAFQAANQGLLNIPVKADSTVLPEAGNIGNAATIIGGVKALEGGIESPGEAVAVANAAIAAASAATAGAAAGTTAAAINAGAAAAGPVGAAIAAAIALEDILAEDMSLKDVIQGLPVVGRWAGGGGATFGTATLGYNGNDFGFVKESSKNKGWTYTMPEMHATNLILNELTDNLGFEVDRNKLKNVNTTIDIDNGRPVRAANDIVLDMINTGAIKPTANTPNNIDWGNLFTEARKYSSGYTEQKTPGSSISDIKKLQSSPSVAAAQAYKTTTPVKTQVGKGYGTTQVPGIISKTGKPVYSKNLTNASYAKFANQDDAYNFAADPGNIKKTFIPGRINPKNRRKEPDTVEVKYFEVQKDNSLRQKTKTMSPAAAQNFAVSKPAPPPVYGGFGINFSGIDFSKLGFLP